MKRQRLIRDSHRDTSSVIILFSAGCKDSYSVIESVLFDVWIVEPHFSYGGNIRKCISIGFPKNRVIVGPHKARGYLIPRDEIMEHFKIYKNIKNKII